MRVVRPIPEPEARREADVTGRQQRHYYEWPFRDYPSLNGAIVGLLVVAVFAVPIGLIYGW